jgi:hypothetical protein
LLFDASILDAARLDAASPAEAADSGPLEPVRAGTAVEAATSDAAHLRTLLGADLDPARRARGASNPVVPPVRDLTAAVRALAARPAGGRAAAPRGIADLGADPSSPS